MSQISVAVNASHSGQLCRFYTCKSCIAALAEVCGVDVEADVSYSIVSLLQEMAGNMAV